ncbi:hypothetical protein P7K49_003919 [Saguinus oedipus]|uniref:Uncharacterized protein n=1 Tax=Saguinus oedipus TaxID=9490 RepID=A0ABQ9W5W6_SAGOE|nr:hypothetical protein P7K49_003919 [Saguinus oedipus]
MPEDVQDQAELGLAGPWTSVHLRGAPGKILDEIVAVPGVAHGQQQGLPGVARPHPPTMLQCRQAQEFSFGPRALKDALISTDAALQQLYASAFSPAERLFLAEAYNPQRTLFCTLLIRTAFDWLLSRPEPPEDFQTFHASLQHRRPSLTRKHIYLQPIGTGHLQPSAPFQGTSLDRAQGGGIYA